MLVARALPWVVFPIGAAVCGCGGRQSALNPAGRDAERIADLFWPMAIGAALIWAAVIGTAIYAVARRHRQHSVRAANLFIVVGGVTIPTIVLAFLLIGGLSMLPALLDLGPSSTPGITVVAEQWWWRVQYRTPQGETIELANELRLPVGHRTAIAVESPDVVHSFWVPSLAGKVDAIPGRTTFIGLEPTRTGTFEGVCAEYCGDAHAQMLFETVVMEPDEYDRWVQQQAEPAQMPADPVARRGQAAFLKHGCGACHAVRGTAATGRVGPDLTHVGSRQTIAGVLDNDVEGFRRWLAAPKHHKPAAHMPAFDMLPAHDLEAVATYLDGLQ